MKMQRRTFIAAATAALSVRAIALRHSRAWAADGGDVPALGPDGAQRVLSAADIEDFRAGMRGELLTPGQQGYETARHVWNGAFDRKPALIARCAGTADVIRSVNFGRTHGLVVAVRGGGHSLSGQSVCNGGLMIDLSPMKSVHVDPAAKIGRLEPGVLLGQFDREALAFGLATTAGTVSHTGAAGLTLGGGFGRLGRKYGLTCDNMRAAEIVTGTGKLLRVSEQENAELLWGLRGGGGNFGVVTSFEYRLHDVNPIMLGGPLLYSLDQAKDVLRFFSDFIASAPDELYIDAALLPTPEGRRALLLDVCYCGPFDQGERVLAPLRKFRKPLVDGVHPTPYVDLQRSADAANPHGRSYYTKSGFLRHIEPALIDAAVDSVAGAQTPNALIILSHSGGAIGRVKPTATAYLHREANHSLLILSYWDKPADADAATQWARNTWRQLEPMTDGFYVNEVTADDSERKIRTNYGANYPRLVKLKNQYDPTNLLRMNANIKPTV
jgi:FAD/FMN-containing dehydrogenase